LSAEHADIVICGAGIAGVAAAYELCVRRHVADVVLVDERPPLTLTSDKSTEAYRNFWPGPDDAMIRLMNRSLDLLEALAAESGNVFHMNRRGYVYATADAEQARKLEHAAQRASELGAGPLRRHTGAPGEAAYVPSPSEGFEGQPDGADLLLGTKLLREHFAYLTNRTCAVLHARRCGWFSGQQLGMYLLEKAQENGARLLHGRVTGVGLTRGRVDHVQVDRPGGTTRISTRQFVDAAGPRISQVAALIGVELPIFSELHLKASFQDFLGVVPREAPLLIWDDPQHLPWSDEERTTLGESDETRWLLERFPASVHARPEGGIGSQNLLILWPYHVHPVEPVFPLPEDPSFPEIALRGMSTLIPGLRTYLERMPKAFVDGGYYTKTAENRFLSCPLPVDGAYVLGALSGYGLMAACAAAELLAAHVTRAPLPAYAQAFSLERYADPAYRRLVEEWGSTGQL
jgi:glycine/D-amino acid oxidase-like deaminating enzyme